MRADRVDGIFNPSQTTTMRDSLYLKIQPIEMNSCRIHKIWIFILILPLFLPQTVFGQAIETIAGGGVADGAAALDASLNTPLSVCFDHLGNLYIADTNNHRIRKVDQNGIITTVAGNGTSGYSGDQGLAINAQLNYPTDMVVDKAGILYISDTNNHRIRRVAGNGIITTYVGTGTPGDSGDGGAAVDAEISGPQGLAIDESRNLYIADTMNNRIRKVDINGTIITVAGSGQYDDTGDGALAINASMKSPSGVDVDSSGNLYIADTFNNKIRKVDKDGIITTVAGSGMYGFTGDDGPAIQAQIDSPSDVAVDRLGNLYISDYGNQRIRKVRIDGTITTIAGDGTDGFAGDGGPARNAQLYFPYGIVADTAGSVFIADSNNNRIRKISSTGLITTIAGNGFFAYSGDGGAGINAALNSPSSIAVDTVGNIFIADSYNHVVRKLTPDGSITTVAGNGTSGFSGDGDDAVLAQLNTPSGVAVDRDGNLYISDKYNNRVRKVNPAGVITTVVGTGHYGDSGDFGPGTDATMKYPAGLAMDNTGNLYIADQNNHRIRKLSKNGIITTVAGKGIAGYWGENSPAVNAMLNYPADVAIDSNGVIYIADYYNHRVRKVGTDGNITTIAGNGIQGYFGEDIPGTLSRLNFPAGVTVDQSGVLYIADKKNNRVRRINAAGMIATVAGNGTYGFSGDKAEATNASLRNPSGLAVDVAGNLCIADELNNRIRRIAFNSAPTAMPDTAYTRGILPVEIDVMANDTDTDGDEFTVTDVTQGEYGSVVINSSGTVTYTAIEKYIGDDLFVYTITDSGNAKAVGSVLVTVDKPNTAPVAVDDNKTTGIGMPVTIKVLENDIDLDEDILTVVDFTLPSHGAVDYDGEGGFLYVPLVGYRGSDMFSYTIDDGYGLTNRGNVFITVSNMPPTANDDEENTRKDNPVVIFPLSNDSDPEGTSLTLTGASEAENGTVTFEGGSSVTYTPDAGFIGIDTFTYTVRDEDGGGSAGTVTIFVTSLNAPIAFDDTASTNEDSPLAINLNGDDADGDTITFATATVPVHGELSEFNPVTGWITYSPDLNYFGEDSFTFRANDGMRNSNIATVLITVRPVDDLPLVESIEITMLEDTSEHVELIGRDPDQKQLIYTILEQPSHGVITNFVNFQGTLLYTPFTNYHGVDSFTYKMNDGVSDTDPATVSFTIEPVNDPPIVYAQSVWTYEKTSLPITLQGFRSRWDCYALLRNRSIPQKRHDLRFQWWRWNTQLYPQCACS